MVHRIGENIHFFILGGWRQDVVAALRQGNDQALKFYILRLKVEVINKFAIPYIFAMAIFYIGRRAYETMEPNRVPCESMYDVIQVTPDCVVKIGSLMKLAAWSIGIFTTLNLLREGYAIHQEWVGIRDLQRQLDERPPG